MIMRHDIITRKIKNTYKSRLINPILYLLFLLAIWLYTPISQIIFPVHLDNISTLSEAYRDGTRFAYLNLKDLYFTGYTRTGLLGTSGYYYYTVDDDVYSFVLLSPKTCEEGLPTVEKADVYVNLKQNNNSLNSLYSAIASDLNWSEVGTMNSASPIFISEPAYYPAESRVLAFWFFVTLVYAIYSAAVYFVYALFPMASPTVKQLKMYGNGRRLFYEAEEELATLPQLATEDIYITEHFFIAFANKRVDVIPISEIRWIYKHSTLHKILWYHLRISDTLHITANKRLYISYPKNMQSDIDGIIDYLAEANHDILVGFSEKNRRKLQDESGLSRFWAGFLGFLKQRV